MNRLLPLTLLLCTLRLAVAAPATESPGKGYLFSCIMPEESK